MSGAAACHAQATRRRSLKRSLRLLPEHRLQNVLLPGASYPEQAAAVTNEDEVMKMSTRITPVEAGHKIQLPAEWAAELGLGKVAALEKTEAGGLMLPLPPSPPSVAD